MGGTDSERDKAALERAAMESLESLAFAEAMPEAAPQGFPAGMDCAAAVIPVDAGGGLALWVERKFLRGIAATLFTLPEAQVDAAMLQDALLEFLNIVAGRFMAMDDRADRVMTLGLPRALPEGTGMSGYPVALFFRTEPEGCFAVGVKAS